MQKDFHFYCIAVLARAAGFSRKDALVMAYCSQYVDDATEGDPITVQVNGQTVRIDPVRSSYDYLKPNQGLESLDWAAQKRVHIPFHFLPARPLDPDHPSFPFSYVTLPNSVFAGLLLSNAAAETHPLRRLCRMGIALHTLADTWAHQGFSGLKEAGNDVENIKVRDPFTKRWKKPLIENLIDDLLLVGIPDIGHADALYFPDVSYLEWKCEMGPAMQPGGGYNALRFLEAAQMIYERLRQLNAAQIVAPDPISWRGRQVDFVPWEELALLIQERLVTWPKVLPGLFAEIVKLRQILNPDQRCQIWQEVFREWFEPVPGGFPNRYTYDRLAFRRHALQGDVQWDERPSSQWQQQEPYQAAASNLHDFWNTPWAQFHRGALMQRHTVLERLP